MLRQVDELVCSRSGHWRAYERITAAPREPLAVFRHTPGLLYQGVGFGIGLQALGKRGNVLLKMRHRKPAHVSDAASSIEHCHAYQEPEGRFRIQHLDRA